jgi:type I restriction enzyme S subunit
LVVTRSGILKHTLPIATNIIPVAINQDIKAFVPLGECEVSFLAAQLRLFAPKILRSVRMGATVQNLETDALKQLPFLNPPVSSQQAFAQYVGAIRKIQTEQAKRRFRLDDLFQSMLHNAFNGSL